MIGNPVKSTARFLAVVILNILFLVLTARAGTQDKKASASKNPGNSQDQSTAPTTPRDEQEQSALNKAFDDAAGNPQVLIKNLEEFLQKYPDSVRREQVLRTIYRQAQQANDPAKGVSAGEALLKTNPGDFALLSGVIDLLSRRDDAESRRRALDYAGKFVDSTLQLTPEGLPGDVPPAKFDETRSLMQAAAFAIRARIYANSDAPDKALEDYRKSFAAYPSAQVAARMADLEVSQGANDAAINDYARAFVFPDKSPDPADRASLRQKLGSLYIQQHKSEQGLGDLILEQYDELSKTLQPRLQGESRPNAAVHNPFEFVLQKLDGSTVKLSDLRGKILVMDFWATWCGPCRLQGRLFEQVLAKFAGEPQVQFLAINVDEDHSGVPGFIKAEKWTMPVAYGQGLDNMMGVHSLPTTLIFDRAEHVIFRQDGLDPDSFTATMILKIQEALKAPAGSAAGAR